MIGKLPLFARMAILTTIEAIMALRKPDVIIGTSENPYLHRWLLAPRGKNANVYIHRMYRDDHAADLHDHRYRNVSMILKGRCLEHFHSEPLRVQDGKFVTYSIVRDEGDIVERGPTMPHRLSLIDGKPMTTIFFTGEEEREWGFHTVDGWMGWREYNAKTGRPNGTYMESSK